MITKQPIEIVLEQRKPNHSSCILIAPFWGGAELWVGLSVFVQCNNSLDYFFTTVSPPWDALVMSFSLVFNVMNEALWL